MREVFMKKLFTGTFLLLAILLLSSCSSLMRVDTFNKQYAVGMTAVQAVYSITATGVEAGKISKEDGRLLMQHADAVRNFFGTARINYAVNPEEGISCMNYALAALQALQDELTQKSKP